jgi:hypothetical protein
MADVKYRARLVGGLGTNCGEMGAHPPISRCILTNLISLWLAIRRNWRHLVYTFLKLAGAGLILFGLFAMVAGHEMVLGNSCVIAGLSLIISATLFRALNEHLEQMREQTRTLKEILQRLPEQPN